MSTDIDKKYIYICRILNSLIKYERRRIMAKAIKRAYSTSGGGVDMESMQELFYGSIEERQALATAITSKGVPTEVSNTLEVLLLTLFKASKTG